MAQRKLPLFIGAVLQALGRNVTNTTRVFTVSELVVWSREFTSAPGLAKSALKLLGNRQIVEQVYDPAGKFMSISRYRLTRQGLATCRAAAQAAPGAPPNPSALSTRLWNLLRARRMTTAEEATEVLANAGEEGATRMQRSIAEYLRVWAVIVPDTIKISAQRVNGRKRYVLTKDTGIHPPPVKVSAKGAAE